MKDFSKMTLDELTPIISMRPGKEYTREELKEARAVFMQLLNGSEGTPTTFEPSAPSQDAAPTEAPAEEAPVAEVPTVETPTTAQPPANDEAFRAQTIVFPIVPEARPTEQPTPPVAEEPTPPAAEEAALPKDTQEEWFEPQEAEKEGFILHTGNKFARILYIAYAYLILPLLTLESLVYLFSGVLTAIAVPRVSYMLIYILICALYAMFVSVAWHQFMHRTRAALFFNRTLIAVKLVQGILRVFTPGELFSGILLVAVALLFMVFFFGYDNTFTGE